MKGKNIAAESVQQLGGTAVSPGAMVSLLSPGGGRSCVSPPGAASDRFPLAPGMSQGVGMSLSPPPCRPDRVTHPRARQDITGPALLLSLVRSGRITPGFLWFLEEKGGERQSWAGGIRDSGQLNLTSAGSS